MVFSCVRVALAVVLVGSSFVKLDAWRPDTGFVYVVIAAGEVLIAWFLVFGQRAFAWWTATTVLTGFSVVSGVNAWNGGNCNCFGAYTDTRFVLLFDVTALACFLACGYRDPSLMKIAGARPKLDCSVAYPCILAMMAVIYLPHYSRAFGQPILHPDTVDGITVEEFFHHSNYTGADEVQNGYLILLRPECGKCHEFLSSSAFAKWRESKVDKVALLYAWIDSGEAWKVGDTPESGRTFHWTTRPGWFTETPVVVHVVDGRIRQVLSASAMLQE